MSEESPSKSKSWKPETVWQVSEAMQLLERTRAADRALINNQFNGIPPYTSEEVKTYQIHVNVNFQEGKQILVPAINQLNNALIFKERFFSASSKEGDPEKREEYSMTFTRNIHEHLKNGSSGQYQMFLLKSRNAALALHGIGPIMWLNDFGWRGKFIPLEDLLIPTDTLCDFSNLMFFAVNLYPTVGQFVDMVSSGGWATKLCNSIIKELVKPSQAQGSQWFDSAWQPEKQIEWLKQNRIYWDHDATTTVKLRMFFYKDATDKKWHRCVILRENVAGVQVDLLKEFLFDGSDKPFADKLCHILHVQFGDNSIVAPLKYHSVRGLGVDLYGPVECNNRTRCEFQQHVLFSLKTLLRITNPIDRDRPKVLDLTQYSVVEDGISFVPAADRYQIDPRLIESALSHNKQMMGEAGSSYVRDVEAASGQPRTATETNVLANQATESVSNMLQGVYAQEEFYWQEEVRRFCRKNSEDEEVKEFREKCIADGIPEELMEASNWAIKIERALGGGDQFMANQEATALLGNSQRFDPTAQRTILRKWVTTTTRDPKMAELLVPDDDRSASDGTVAAEDVFGTLMQGIPASIREGIERTDYVEALLSMMTEKISQIERIDNVGTPQDVIGLHATAAHIGQNIQILAMDPMLKQNVKIYSDQLGKLMNKVKAFGQRQQEAADKKAESEQINPEAQAKAQATAMLAQQKMQLNEASTTQKIHQKQMAFEVEMQQRMEKHQLEMQQEMQKAQTQIASEGVRTGAQISNDKAKTEAAIENQKKQTDAKPKTVNN